MNKLSAMAFEMRDRAQAPYSGFRVGAAIESSDGRMFGGCNIESSSYGLTICAERVALVKALSEGSTDFRRIVVATGDQRPTPPCGACRQLLWDYCRDIEVVLENSSGLRETYSLRELLPHAFDSDHLR